MYNTVTKSWAILPVKCLDTLSHCKVVIKKRYIYSHVTNNNNNIARLDTLRLKDDWQTFQVEIPTHDVNFMFTFGSTPENTGIVICGKNKPKNFFILKPETREISSHASPITAKVTFGDPFTTFPLDSAKLLLRTDSGM